MSVLVVLEQREGKWNRMSFEAITAGQKIASNLGMPVEASVVGSGVESLAKEAAKYGVAKVFALDHELLAQYTPDGTRRRWSN